MLAEGNRLHGGEAAANAMVAKMKTSITLVSMINHEEALGTSFDDCLVDERWCGERNWLFYSVAW